MNSRTTVVVALAAVVLAAAAGWWWYGSNAQAPVARPAPPPPPAQVAEVKPITPEPEPAAPPPPAIEHPIEAVAEAEAPVDVPAQMPEIEDSDALLLKALGHVLQPEWGQWLNLDGLVRRVVATVDNLPRSKLAPRLSPFKAVPGPFLAMNGGVGRFIGQDNHARYLPYVVALDAVNLKAVVGVYRAYYALFQKAYRDLGYPNGYFNDRLVAVIDHLLATPEVEEPIRVVQPKVLYEYADPRLESFSAGQKMMLRMGRDNASHVKARLATLRALLVQKN